VIPLFIDAILKGESPKINGDGNQTRDFTFVANAVQANIRALFASKEAANEVFNVAVGEQTSLNQLFQFLKQTAQSDIEPIYREARLGDIRDSLADISKAQNLLGYQPTHRIQEGLALTLEWFKEKSKK
jgi:UDP-N-acetylglucosamine 4-epimerase